jgi:hypothetical protein
MFSLAVWLRGFWVSAKRRITAGRIVGDPWQMPGLFLIHRGEVVYSFRPQLVSDIPDLRAVLGPVLSASN